MAPRKAHWRALGVVSWEEASQTSRWAETPPYRDAVGVTLMFSMDLDFGESGSHVVVVLRGELDLMDAAAVTAALRAVVACQPWIIVDLAGLEFIDATGVGALSRGRRHARNAGGDLLLAAPRGLVRRVLEIIWEAAGSGLHASVAEAAASAGAARQAVVPIQRQAAKMRAQRMAMNAPAPRRRAVTGDWLTPGSWVPCRRPPTASGTSG
jgi:anti-sigma B factor antagonist